MGRYSSARSFVLYVDDKAGVQKTITKKIKQKKEDVGVVQS